MESQPSDGTTTCKGYQKIEEEEEVNICLPCLYFLFNFFTLVDGEKMIYITHIILSAAYHLLLEAVSTDRVRVHMLMKIVDPV